MNRLTYYRGDGQPATAIVIVRKVPTTTPKVTINGINYVYGTDFVGDTVQGMARALGAAVNADVETYGFLHTKSNPISAVHAQVYGSKIVLIAVEPGAGGNSLTLSTDSAEHFQVSGATFSGGA